MGISDPDQVTNLWPSTSNKTTARCHSCNNWAEKLQSHFHVNHIRVLVQLGRNIHKQKWQCLHIDMNDLLRCWWFCNIFWLDRKCEMRAAAQTFLPFLTSLCQTNEPEVATWEWVTTWHPRWSKQTTHPYPWPHDMWPNKSKLLPLPHQSQVTRCGPDPSPAFLYHFQTHPHREI